MSMHRISSSQIRSGILIEAESDFLALISADNPLPVTIRGSGGA
jgi:hypothetical protein